MADCVLGFSIATVAIALPLLKSSSSLLARLVYLSTSLFNLNTYMDEYQHNAYSKPW